MSTGSKVAGSFVALALWAISVPVHAQDQRAFYVGAGAGESRHSLDEDYYDRFDLPGADLEQSQSSYLVYAGYRAHRFLAIEVDVQDFGGSDQWRTRCLAFTCPQILDFHPHQLRVSTRRASLAFVLIAPLGDRFELFARLGVARTQHDTDVLHDPGMQNIHGERTYETDDLVSAGASFLFDANWALRLQWDRAKSPLESPRFGGTNDIDAISLALEHRFN